MTDLVVGIFALVYLGMMLGGLPFLQIDRTGIALLGAIALIALNAVSLEEAVQSIHLPTLILLFSFMVVSAQMRLGGFYDGVTRWVARLPVGPPLLMGALILLVAALSAVFSNDIVCLAVAPVLIDACRRRDLAPMPLLLALACSANIGSAATLIGNPQNMLIGQTLHLSFASYLMEAALPVGIGLAVTWAIVFALTRGQLSEGAISAAQGGVTEPMAADEEIPLNLWQTIKGLIIVLIIVACFLFTDWPREVVALTGAGVLLTSRQLHSRQMLGLVDWEILILFIGLFVVNHALQKTGLPTRMIADLAAGGMPLQHLGPLVATTFVLSNIVSNVPAVMLLLPAIAHTFAGYTLALVSTLAGNLFIVGSVANIIVIEAASRRGIAISWRDHARIGVPVTVATLAVVVAYMGFRWASAQ
jgi:Na+/H+ antiporter NhaD/arsenite permease-like protein